MTRYIRHETTIRIGTMTHEVWIGVEAPEDHDMSGDGWIRADGMTDEELRAVGIKEFVKV